MDEATKSLLFQDRRDAGRLLAKRLEHLKQEQPVIVGLPRGGVPVAAEVAKALDAPLDVIVVRKLGVPAQEELAMGAIGEANARVLNDDIIRLCRVRDEELQRVESHERLELERREARFRCNRPLVSLKGRSVIIVDDGIATGATGRAALQVARAQGARRIILAVPVASSDTIRKFRSLADEIICLATPPNFHAVGSWYKNFTQTTDEEVCALLSAQQHAASPPGSPVSIDEEVAITVGSVVLGGHLTVPRGAIGVVIFAHGSGSSRFSPRNKLVSDQLHRRALGTLLFDLLSPEEATDRRNVFNIEQLAMRLVAATHWLSRRPGEEKIAKLPIGYFGASTGAAAALWAASDSTVHVDVIVSRGGRPDLAMARLSYVRAPTLLIVGDLDTEVLALNRSAAERLHSEKKVELVSGATHLFEEAGALEQVADLAAAWFTKYFASAHKA